MSLGSKINTVLFITFLAVLASMVPAMVATAWLAPTTFGVPDQLVETLHLTRITLALGVAALGIWLVTLAFLARRTLLKPLRQAIVTLQRIGAGDLSPPACPDGKNEFGDLNRVTAQMVEAFAQMLRDAHSQKSNIAASEARFRDFVEAASDWLWETDASGRVTYFSGDFEDLTGADAQSLIGRPLGVLMQVPQHNGGTREIEFESRRPLRNLVCVHQSADGRERHCRLSGRAFWNDDGAFQGYRGVGTDITDEVNAQKTTDDLAYRDPLTGLANRVLILERLAQALDARQVSQGDVAVLFIDLDRFKRINQTLGHAVGDALLSAVGERLAPIVGPQDTVGRLSADEFAIVQATGAQPELAELLSLDVLRALRQPFEIDGHSISLTASIGCAIAGPNDKSPVNLLRNADVARYRAKNDGCDTFRFHDPAMTEALRSRLGMEQDLRRAVTAGEIEVHYQPMVSAKTQAIVGFEAMIRWPRAGHGLVYPAEFLSLAETAGLIVPLGEQVLMTACRTAMSWPGMILAVNLSPLHFLHEGLPSTVAQVLRETCLAPHLLELEVDERPFLAQPDAAVFQADALHELGVRLVMDKFGSGTSSMQHLRRYPFDKLKLHRSLTADMLNSGSAEITQSILHLAAALNMQTVAMGVKTQPQATHLQQLGCDGLQGRLFGKAMTARRAFALVRSQGLIPGAPLAETHL